MTSMTMLNLLAIDCSTERLVLAVACGERSWVLDEVGGAASSARALPAIQELLVAADLRLADLDAIAYARGPGAFTGLRTACALAQGLAFGVGKPVLAIDSLLIVAEAARVEGGVTAADLWVAMDARMNEAYAARYGWHDRGWQTLSEPALWTAAALTAQLAEDGGTPCVVGSAIDAGLITAIDPRRGASAQARAPALLRLAGAAWRDGQRLDAAQALPVYLRDKVAQTTRERDALRQRAAGATGDAP